MDDINFAGNARKMTDFLGYEWEYDCLGCAIREKKVNVPGGSIYETNHVVLAQDPEIPIPGFLIVNSKRHVNSLIELTKEERYEIIEVVNIAIKALKNLKITNEITIVQEERSKHLHIWLFPNYEWMNEKFGKGITYLRDISTYAQKNVGVEEIEKVMEIIEKLKKYFKENRMEE